MYIHEILRIVKNMPGMIVISSSDLLVSCYTDNVVSTRCAIQEIATYTKHVFTVSHKGHRNLA